MPHSPRPLLLAGALLPIVLVVAGGTWLYSLIKGSEPYYDGSLTLAGIEAPVVLRYGPHAVPSIDAESVEDMVFAQGFAVARERLWQMDLLRRLAGGRLAEVFGEAALPADRFYRTIGLPEAARVTFAALEPRWQRLLQHYADGVNAYIDSARQRVPLEYRFAGFDPAPWRALDSLLVGGYMAWLNAANLREELVFLKLAGRVGTARALELFPADLGQPAPASASSLPDYRLSAKVRSAAGRKHHVSSSDSAQRRRRAQPGRPLWQSPIAAQAASNAWAVTGSRTDGEALLANDPHLPPSAPCTWYELELRAPGYHAAGVALPGVPLILIGHNADLAWGLTASVADTQDLFLERSDQSGSAVLRPDGRLEPIQIRTEQIAVAGRQRPVALQIESTSHGVLIDALLRAPAGNAGGLPPMGRPERLALRLALDEPDRAIVGLWRLNTARTVDQARNAVRDLHHASLNVLIAHRDGTIGWQVSGLLPRRGRGSGTFPVPGWQPGYRWLGFRPATENPGISGPLGDELISANDAMDYDQDSPPIGYSWLAPFRAQRIAELLQTDTVLGLSAMERLQRDHRSLEARLYLRSLRRNLAGVKAIDPEASRLAEQWLLDWDAELDGASRSAALFALLRPALYEALYRDELGPDLEYLMDIDSVTYGPLPETMRADVSSFWDDIRTPDTVEGAPAIWTRALRQAWVELNDALPNPAQQRLDRLRQLTFPHAFRGQPLLGRFFDLGPIGRGGDSSTIDVAGGSPASPRQVSNIASMRVVYRPADWSDSRGTLPLGQSGHRFSRYRADQLADWRDGKSHALPWNGPAAGTEIGVLRLQPD